MGHTNQDDLSATPRWTHSRESAPVEIPEDIFERIRTLCLALPEVTVRVDASLVTATSTAHSFDIRRRSFCLLIALAGAEGESVPQPVLRADPGQRRALLSVGNPFYRSRAWPGSRQGPAHRRHRLGEDP